MLTINSGRNVMYKHEGFEGVYGGDVCNSCGKWKSFRFKFKGGGC